MISFNWPWILLLAPVPLLLWLFKREAISNQQSSRAITVPPALAAALQSIEHQQAGGRRRWLQQLAQICLLLGWCALLIALAQPTRPGASELHQATGRALTLLIDLSTSMERKDFTIDGEPVDRLSVVKTIASQFIAERTGDRIGLVFFGSEAAIASPPSFDLDAVTQILLSSVAGLTGRTTAIGDGLGLAIRTLQNDEAAQRAIILLSDGTNNAGSVEPEDAAKLAAAYAIHVHTIGLGGDRQGGEGNDSQFGGIQSTSADLDEDTLKAIAEASGGQFFRARSSGELEQIYRRIDALERTTERLPPVLISTDLRNLFIALALLMLLSYAALRSKTAVST